MRSDKNLLVTILFFLGLVKFQAQPVVEIAGAKSGFKPAASGASVKVSADVEILDEKTTFYWYDEENERIKKTILFQVNTDKGALEFSGIHLPESFDPAFDGRRMPGSAVSRKTTPDLYDYKAEVFSAWKLVKEARMELSVTNRYVSDNGGQLFTISGVKAGDKIELNYEAKFDSAYGSNLFYFNNAFPKRRSELAIVYKVPVNFRKHDFVKAINIPDSLVRIEENPSRNDVQITYRVRLTNLDKMNYPLNSFQANNLPHLFADFGFFRTIKENYPFGNFSWVVGPDTEQVLRVYDRQHTALKKFLRRLPQLVNDSSRFVFFRSLCDTLNELQYMPQQQVWQRENKVADVYSAEHLLLRRIHGGLQAKLYGDIFHEQEIFYYLVNIVDKRLGEHSTDFRTHFAYEGHLYAVPYKNSFLYIMPRWRGIKYHLNELPFYYEGTVAAFLGKNFPEKVTNKTAGLLRFRRLGGSTQNDNVRSENITVKVPADSASMHLAIKENLSGQFSTLLRHLYLRDPLDSMVNPKYFKKCTDKPGASNVNLRLNSASAEYPFKSVFSCGASIARRSSDTLDLSGWFSLPFSMKNVPELPTHDYYFDFQFTDTYNFLFDFGKKTEILNKGDFTRKVTNEFYTLESDIVTNSETQCLVRVKLVIKKPVLPRDQGHLLVQLGEAASQIDGFKIILKQ